MGEDNMTVENPQRIRILKSGGKPHAVATKEAYLSARNGHGNHADIHHKNIDLTEEDRDLVFDGEDSEINQDAFELLEEIYVDEYRFPPDQARLQVERYRDIFHGEDEIRKRFVEITVRSIIGNYIDKASS